MQEMVHGWLAERSFSWAIELWFEEGIYNM